MNDNEFNAIESATKPTAANPDEPTISLPEACWTLELNCRCPKCDEHVDLLEGDGFWENNQGLQICEHGTEKSRNINAYCNECEHEFKVSLTSTNTPPPTKKF